LKYRRESREGGGLSGGKGKRQGGLRLNSHVLPPLKSKQRKGGRRLGCGRPGAIPDKPGHGSGRAVVQNEGGFTGNRFPYLPWAVVARGGRFPGRWRTGGGGLGGNSAPVCREEGARLVAVRGEVGNATGLFIGAERRFGDASLVGGLAPVSRPRSRSLCPNEFLRVHLPPIQLLLSFYVP
jgi:hypothetical protein